MLLQKFQTFFSTTVFASASAAIADGIFLQELSNGFFCCC
jgi:hypothetical protein